MKNKLAYSAITDDVYYIDGRSQQREISKGNFTQMVLLWLTNSLMPKVGVTRKRTLSINGKPHWEITLKRLA